MKPYFYSSHFLRLAGKQLSPIFNQRHDDKNAMNNAYNGWYLNVGVIGTTLGSSLHGRIISKLTGIQLLISAGNYLPLILIRLRYNVLDNGAVRKVEN